MWIASPRLDLEVCPQIEQGCEAPVMCKDSMCLFMSVKIPSFPHTLQILAFLATLPVFMMFSLNEIEVSVVKNFRHKTN